MNRKLGLFSIIIFLLLAQWATFSHIAKFGVLEHKHSGKSCDIFLNCDKSKIAFFDNSSDQVFLNFTASNFVAEKLLITSNHSDFYFSRAPPFFS